jgi:hypothetical protein
VITVDAEMGTCELMFFFGCGMDSLYTTSAISKVVSLRLAEWWTWIERRSEGFRFGQGVSVCRFAVKVKHWKTG